LLLLQDPSQLFVLKKVKVDEDNDKERSQAEMEVTVLSNLDHPLVLGYVLFYAWQGKEQPATIIPSHALCVFQITHL